MTGALANPRERILSALGAHPGVHLREVPRLVGSSLRAARYHLDLMEREDLVVQRRFGRFVRWFPRGAFSAEEQALIAAVRVRAQREVLRALMAGGPQRFVDLEQRVPTSRMGLSRALRALVEGGIVALPQDRRYALADRGAVAMRLALFRERIPDLLADAADEIFEDAR